MRRVRHLKTPDYIIAVRQKMNRCLAMSNCSNVYLERTWHDNATLPIEISCSVKFNSSTMQGMLIQTFLQKNDRVMASVVSSVKLYKIADGTYAKTYLQDVTMDELVPGIFTKYINQSTLGTSNELSGRETYMLTVELSRVRKKYKKSFWFNHVGCFDSLNRLRLSTEILTINDV